MIVKADRRGNFPAIGRLTTKILLVMKITAFLLLVSCMSVSARGVGQTRVTLDVKQATLETILDKIQEQTGYSYVFAEPLGKTVQKIDLSVHNVTLQEALDLCFKNLPIRYQIENNLIVIRKRQVMVSVPNPGPSNGSNDVVISVTSEDGLRLPGATVKIKAISLEEVTNEKGELDAKGVPNGRYQVEISYVGYQKFQGELDVKNEPVRLSINLKHATNNLDQVQIIAYGQTTQRLNVGDVTTVSSRQLEVHPVSNPLAALEGMVPGLFITQGTGMPGGSFAVQIRGQNSIQNGNNPFYVIDGVPYTSTLLQNQNPAGGGNPLDFFNVSDIESISVLKDADATAIYGSRAANGAILITTKKGKAGKTRLDVNAYTGVGHAPLKVNWLNTAQYLTMRNEAFKNDGESPTIYTDPDLLVWDTTRYTDWQKKMIGGAAKYNDLQASVSGGNANMQVLFGIGYHGESSVFPDAGSDDKVSSHLSVNMSSNDQRFKTAVTINYVYDRSNLPATDLTTFVGATAPDAPNPFNSDGSLNWANGSWVVGDGNPLAFTKQLYVAHTNNLIGNAVLSYHVLKGLDLKSSFGYTDMQIEETATHPAGSQNPVYFPTAYSAFTNNNIHSWIIEPQITYSLPIRKNKFDFLLGTTFNQIFNTGQILNASGFSSDALVADAQAATVLHIGSQTNSIYKYNAFFGRVAYKFDDRYLINLVARRDGSSRFGPEMQFHNFQSARAGWLFSNERFVRDALPILSFGKLSASYGTTGNDQIGDYTYYDLYRPTIYPYQGITGLNPQRLDNPYLAWEETKKIEGGVDLGFLKDKLVLRADYYRNRSSNELLAYPVSTVTGFSSISLNLPAVVQNDGYEATVSINNIRSKHFGWNSSFNVTIPRNKLVKFPNLASSSFNSIYVIGQPVTVIRAFHMTGVDSSTGVYKFATKGDPFNPDFTADRTVNINLSPKFYGGFRNSFSYDGFQLEILLQFVKQLGQKDVFQNTLPAGIAGFNVPSRMLSRWQAPGQKAPYEQFTQDFGSAASNAYSYITSSDYNFMDASFIRLKNVSLSYQFPSGWLNKAHFENARIYVRGENLWTLTRYKGMDPENQTISSLPPLRIVTIGLQVGL